MVDERTAVLAGVLAYIGVLAALGVAVIYLLDFDQVSATSGPGPRFASVAVERPYHTSATSSDRPEASSLPDLRRSVAAK